MNEPFIPLQPAVAPNPGRMDFRVSIINPAENSQPFLPLNRGPGGTSGQHQANCKPQLTLQREGERVSTIRIQCACGQFIELACVYSSATKQT